MNNEREKGIALIITLILVFVMSVMAISLMFVSQSETWSSLNYRLMSQTRDGAEAGINSAASSGMRRAPGATPARRSASRRLGVTSEARGSSSSR